MKDLVLIASSLEGLQSQLDSLACFCDFVSWLLILVRLQVMFFNATKDTVLVAFLLQRRTS